MNTTDTLPLAQRITQGQLTINPPENPDIFTGKPGTFWLIGGDVALSNSAANAELIAEAFNVTHETGKTPRQLAHERSELTEVLVKLLFCGGILHREDRIAVEKLLTRLNS